MDTNLLRSWLGLPPGPWPPDDRALLGLPPGAVDPADVERLALQRMSKLRSHQLVHPDLVTEGMNRLAQAMLAISMAAGSAPAPEPVTEIVTDLRVKTAPSSMEQPIALEAVPVLEAKPFEKPGPPPPVGAKPSRITVPPPAIDSGPPGLIGATRAARRAVYRELAGLRALVRAWDLLHSSFGTPGETLAGAADVYDLLDGVAQVRDAATHPGLSVSLVRDAAPRVEAVLRQPLAVTIFRSLTTAQRQSLAKEWATARARFTGRMVRLRDDLKRSKPPAPLVTGAGLENLLAGHPEWVLVMAMLAVFAVAAVRVALR